MRELDSVDPRFREAFHAARMCLFYARNLDTLVSDTIENRSCPRRPSETEFAYQESLLGPGRLAEETIPRLQSEIDHAENAIALVENELAEVFDMPAEVGGRAYDSYHVGVRAVAAGTLSTIIFGLRNCPPKASFDERWLIFCQRLSKRGERLADLQQDVLIAMLRKEAIRADRLMNEREKPETKTDSTKKRPGRKPVWHRLRELISEVLKTEPDLGNGEIANRYNKRHRSGPRADAVVVRREKCKVQPIAKRLKTSS